MKTLFEFLSTNIDNKMVDKMKKDISVERVKKEMMDDVDPKNCFYDWFPKQKDYPDHLKPRATNGGKVNLWWKWYKMLCVYGPMPKKELLEKLGLKPTSYSSMFAELADQCIIVPNRKIKKLEPQPVENWKVKHVKTQVGTFFSGKPQYGWHWEKE